MRIPWREQCPEFVVTSRGVGGFSGHSRVSERHARSGPGGSRALGERHCSCCFGKHGETVRLAPATSVTARRSSRRVRLPFIVSLLLLPAAASLAASSGPSPSEASRCDVPGTSSKNPFISPWARSQNLRVEPDPEPSKGEEAAVAPEPPPAPVAPPPPKRLWGAGGEGPALELIPWAYDRYIADQEWARISTDTVKDNFDTGFVYDHDDFPTNQFGHPYHGSTFFNAARSN